MCAAGTGGVLSIPGPATAADPPTAARPVTAAMTLWNSLAEPRPTAEVLADAAAELEAGGDDRGQIPGPAAGSAAGEASSGETDLAFLPPIQQRQDNPAIAWLLQGDSLRATWFDGVDREALAAFYDRRDHRPIWVSRTGDLARARAILDLLRNAAAEGLAPADYRVDQIDTSLQRLHTLEQVARAELLVSGALLRYVGDLRDGRPAARALQTAEAPAPEPLSVDAVLMGALRAPDLARFVSGFAPDAPAYVDLRTRLQSYLALRDAGGWPTVPRARRLQLGDTGPAVRALNRRLAAEEDLSGYDPRPERFDTETDLAVRRFQARHGLTADGVVGPQTLAALNAPVSRRIEDLIMAMERWRWLPRDLGDRHVRINLAAYRTDLYEHGRSVLGMDAIIGRTDRQTPVFSDEITYLEFNPAWTVPPTLMRLDYAPKLRRDPGYLARNNMTLYATYESGARRIDPRGVDWSSAGRGYRLVRAPGPGNPLGRVKFMFPNGHHVYMHDTPSRHLFDRPQKTFSSGCVRLSDPLALAEALLDQTPEWDRDRIDRTLKAGTRVQVPLAAPVPVHITYFTTWIDADGRLQHRDDVYGRDAALRRALFGDQTAS